MQEADSTGENQFHCALQQPAVQEAVQQKRQPSSAGGSTANKAVQAAGWYMLG
jgi:hypothetical protein